MWLPFCPTDWIVVSALFPPPADLNFQRLFTYICNNWKTDFVWPWESSLWPVRQTTLLLSEKDHPCVCVIGNVEQSVEYRRMISIRNNCVASIIRMVGKSKWDSLDKMLSLVLTLYMCSGLMSSSIHSFIHPFIHSFIHFILSSYHIQVLLSAWGYEDKQDSFSAFTERPVQSPI